MKYIKGRKQRRREKFRRRYNKKLIARYPWLMPRNVWSDKIPEDYDYSYTLYDDIPRGWARAFGMMMVEEIDQVLRKADYQEEFRIVEIKEKFGELRIYHNGVPKAISDELRDILNKYETISEHVCLDCGRPDVKVTDSGWIMPLCKRCFDNLYWRRNGSKEKPYEDFCHPKDDGRIEESYTIRTYSKDETTDQTYDISDTVREVRRRYVQRLQNRRPGP